MRRLLLIVFPSMVVAATASAHLQPPESVSDSMMTREAPVTRDKPTFSPTPGSHMGMVFQKTILGVNVLRLDIEVDAACARNLVKVRSKPDSVAACVMEAPEAWAHMQFMRSVSQSKFFGGIRSNLAKARQAGFITPEHEKRVRGQLPDWYGFLAKRGVKKGDVLVYWMRGTVMKTTYYDPQGAVLFNFTQENPEARRGVLGSYFAPGSDFREGLIKSLGR